MAKVNAELIWFNGELMPWQNATVHVMSHALHYGSSVFEGIRAYNTHKGTCIFRLEEHIPYEHSFYRSRSGSSV